MKIPKNNKVILRNEESTNSSLKKDLRFKIYDLRKKFKSVISRVSEKSSLARNLSSGVKQLFSLSSGAKRSGVEGSLKLFKNTRFIKNFKKPLYSALIFFGTLIVLSVGYTAWNNAMTQVGTGSGLTATSWNAIVDNINDLNSRSWGLNGQASYYTAGNVGIGSNSPQTTLSIYKPIIGKTTSVQDSHIYIRGADNGYGLAFGILNTSTAGFLQTKLNDSSATLPLLLNPDGGNVGIGTTSPGALLNIVAPNSGPWGFSLRNNTFSTMETGAFRIYQSNVGTTSMQNNSYYTISMDAAGNVGIGTTSPTSKLYVNGTSGGTNTWVSSSDIRYKKNITTIPNSLDKILKLNGVYFDWKTKEYPDKNFKTTKDMGVIAQEVEKVFPEVVSTDSNGYKSVAYSNLVAPLIEAIKEQQKQIEELKNEVKELKSER